MRLVTTLTAFLLVASAGVLGRLPQGPPATPQAPQGPSPTFRSGVNVILVDVDVRDKSGQAVKGLKQSDFEILEDGRPQQVVTFAYEEITTTAVAIGAGTLLKHVRTRS